MNSHSRAKLQQQCLDTLIIFCRVIQFSFVHTWTSVCLYFQTSRQVPSSLKQLNPYLKPHPYANIISSYWILNWFLKSRWSWGMCFAENPEQCMFSCLYAKNSTFVGVKTFAIAHLWAFSLMPLLTCVVLSECRSCFYFIVNLLLRRNLCTKPSL